MNKRNPNYTKAETETLVSLVADYIDIIECKKSDTINLRRKEESWKFIEKIFNMDSTVYRNYKELRKKYENLKANWKRKAPDDTLTKSSLNRRVRGVPPKKLKSNDEEEDKNVNTILDSNEMVEIKNEFDNNDEYNETNRENNNIPNTILDDDENKAAHLEEFTFSDTEANDFWQKHAEHVTATTTPQCEKFDYTSDNAKSSTSSGNKLFKIREEKWSEEEKLRMETECLREQHEAFLQNKMLERQFLIEQQEMAREKHKIEMAILRLELERKKRELRVENTL